MPIFSSGSLGIQGQYNLSHASPDIRASIDPALPYAMLNPMKRLTSTFSTPAKSLILSLILMAALGAAVAADSPLVGVWQLDSGTSAQAGLYLFTPTHYSMVLAATDRPDVADTNKATADELRAIWGPLLANAGTYDISGDLITIHPAVAKFPVVMKAGANEVYRFHGEGKTLTLQQVRNARGVTVAQAAMLKFIRVE
jgi:Lipocalin-like domain